MRRQGIVLLLVAGLTGLTGLTGLAGAVGAPAEAGVSPLPDGYRYVYDGGSRQLVRLPAGTAAADGPVLEHRFVIACSSGNTGDVDLSCTRAATTCQPGAMRNWVDSRPAGSTGAWTRAADSVCLAPSDFVDVGDVLARLHEELERRLPRPSFAIQPASVALVRLPVLVAARLHEPAVLDVTLPVPGRLEAAPASYAWDFGDGGSGEGVGRRYDGTSPFSAPGHYVAHAYSTTGAQRVTLTVTWSATFQLAGGPQLPVPPVVRTAVGGVTVREARAQLVYDRA